MQQEDRKTGRFDDGSEQIVGACIEVHRALGPNLLESVYEACLVHELTLRKLPYERQRPVPVNYKGSTLTAVIDLTSLLLSHFLSS